jgi:hypothetical protein
MKYIIKPTRAKRIIGLPKNGAGGAGCAPEAGCVAGWAVDAVEVVVGAAVSAKIAFQYIMKMAG